MPMMAEEVKTQTGKLVWLQTLEGLKSKEVRTGISDGIYTEVLEGVQEGESVVTGIRLPEKAANVKKTKPGGNPLMPNMTGARPQH